MLFKLIYKKFIQKIFQQYISLVLLKRGRLGDRFLQWISKCEDKSEIPFPL